MSSFFSSLLCLRVCGGVFYDPLAVTMCTDKTEAYFICVFDVQRDFYCLIRRARRSKRHGVMDVAVITVSNMELNVLLGIW